MINGKNMLKKSRIPNIGVVTFGFFYHTIKNNFGIKMILDSNYTSNVMKYHMEMGTVLA